MFYNWKQLSPAARECLTKAHGEMRNAIDDEMAAGGKPPVTLPAGHRIGDAGGAMRWTYRFAIAVPRDVNIGDAVTCRFPSPTIPGGTLAYSGIVAAGSSRQLVVTLRDDLGLQIAAGGRYVPRESVCLVDVQEQLCRVTEGLAAFNAVVALKLLGEHALASSLVVGPATGDIAPPLTTACDGLAFEQTQAVDAFLTQDLAVLWGPPGTGKTHVVASGVVSHARHGVALSRAVAFDQAPARPRILVVATSNLAVDEAMSRIASELSDVHSVRSGRVLRYGRQVTQALVDSHGGQIVYDRVVARIRSERMQRAVQVAERYETRLDEFNDASDLLHNLPMSFEDERARLQRRHARLSWYVARFEVIVREHVRRFQHAYRDERGLAREVLDSSQVLGTTVHQALMSRRIRDTQWDCIVLEEGSQISSALGYALAIRARDTTWLAGDFRQLEPVTESDTPLAQRWMARDLFATSRSYSEGANDSIVTEQFVSRLEVQYRMHPDICAAVNAAYGGALRTDAATARDRLSSDLTLPFHQLTGPAQRGIYLVDTSELAPATRALKGGSRENPTHVAVVRALLEVFDAHGLMPEVGSSPGRIAVISPFQAQARWIATVVERRFPGRGIRSDTVHAYQGQGVDLLVVDLTESRGLKLTDWMHASEWSDSGARLLTVALSRCRERCIVVADCASLYEQLQSIAPRPKVYRLLRYLEEYGGAIDVQRDIISPVQALRQARRLAEENAAVPLRGQAG